MRLEWNCPRNGVFFAGNPQVIYKFLDQLKILFRVQNIKTDDKKLEILLTSLVGPAIVWFKSYLEKIKKNEGSRSITYKEAKEALKTNFEPPGSELMALRKVTRARQRGFVRDFDTEFSEALKNFEFQEKLEEVWALRLYLAGLKENIAIAVFQKGPKTLFEAMWFGIDADHISHVGEKRPCDDTQDINGNYQRSHYKKNVRSLQKNRKQECFNCK